MNELMQIKKYYGEDMMKFCRANFSTILESPGDLLNILEEHFAHSKYLMNDILTEEYEEEFKNYIYSFFDVEKKEIVTFKNPYQLMSDAGYNLYECKTESEIQSFRHYYFRKGPTPEYVIGKPIEGWRDEESCTFNGGRLNRCYVFFAVKKNVDDIKRENFEKPSRQDEYGTSVISIQFSKGDVNTLSIKNRYNHSVNNPDATFSNNLDKIIPGLTKSFEDYFGYNINQNNNLFDLDGYVLAHDGKFYRYNYEIGNIYYCPDNIIIDHGTVIDKYAREKERYLVLDYFIFDLKEKKIFLYDILVKDSFSQMFEDIKRIKIDKQKTGGKVITVITEKGDVRIVSDKFNQMMEIENDFVREVGDKFLAKNWNLKKISLSNVKAIGNEFLFFNKGLNLFNAPKLEKIGDSFLFGGSALEKLYLPNVKEMGDDCLYGNSTIKSLYIPKIKKIGNLCLGLNKLLDTVYINCLRKCEDEFFLYDEYTNQFHYPLYDSSGLIPFAKSLFQKNENLKIYNEEGVSCEIRRKSFR